VAGPPSIQIISTSLVLAGEQRARLDAHAANTEEATLTMLWGSLMLTISALHQAMHLREGLSCTPERRVAWSRWRQHCLVVALGSGVPRGALR